MTLITRPIIEETYSYMLLAPDERSLDPGFLILHPKSIGNKQMWISKVKRYLQLYNEPNNFTGPLPINAIVYEENQWQSFNAKDGSIKINSGLNEVAIEENHPKKYEVISDLMRLWFLTSKNIRYAKIPT